MDRQTLRDWVHRYNAEGLAGLSNRKQPRPQHPKADGAAQEAFEKTSPRRWRRRRPDGEKARIVAESFEPGVSVSAAARRHRLQPSQLFVWRRPAR